LWFDFEFSTQKEEQWWEYGATFQL